MKKIFCRSFIILLLMSNLSANLKSQTDSSNVWTEKTASDWFKKGEWLNGLKLKPHKSINQLTFARQYHNHQKWWDEAFAYLKNTDLASLKPGRYEIDGDNVYATVAEADKKEFEATKWESHRKYQDIQLVISGKEKMGKAQIPTLKIIEPYDATKDITFYQGDGDYYLAEPGTFFIFFPQDGHRPDIKVKGIDKDKKIVIKVRTN